MKKSDKLFINGRIYTMDSKNKTAEALAVKGDTIIAIGSNQEILQLKEHNTEIIDLGGKAVIPGLIDSHTHIFRTGLSELDEELFIPQSIPELTQYIKTKVNNIPKGEWIYLRNVYPTRLKEHRYPTVQELDLVSPNHPVFVDGAYAGRINSCAMKLTEISQAAPPHQILATIRRYIGGSQYNLDDYKKGIQNMQKRYNRLGITSIINGDADEIGIRAANELYRDKKLNVRMTYTKAVENKDTALGEMKNLEDIIKLPRKWGKLAFMKVIIDGGILTGTAYMRRPYRDMRGIFGIEEGFRGIIFQDMQSIRGFIEAADKGGYQMTAHCVGDAALDILLKAYEDYQGVANIKDRRFSIIHGNFTDDRALETISELGLLLLFQPAWHFKDGVILKEVLDEETFDCFLPYSKYVNMGIFGAAGSDHMVKYDPLLSQNPYNPFWALYNMVTGNTLNGNPTGGRWKISRHEALRFYTVGGAYATFDENIKGSLELGKLADFAVLSDDYFTCPCEKIPRITSTLTVIGGKCCY